MILWGWPNKFLICYFSGWSATSLLHAGEGLGENMSLLVLCCWPHSLPRHYIGNGRNTVSRALGQDYYQTYVRTKVERKLFSALFRAFLNLWFAKPMVCLRVAFHENDGNHENDEDNSDSYKQAVECWIRRNHENPRK